MSVVVGLDLSLTATGGAWWEAGQRPLLDTIGPRNETGLERLQKIRLEVVRRTRGADLVVIEALMPAGHTKNAAYANEKAAGHFMVLDHLQQLGIRYVEVPSAVLKGYALGVGGGANATKAAVIAAVVRRYDAQPRNDNEADACVLAAMGLDALGHPPAPVPVANRAWLEKVKGWPA